MTASTSRKGHCGDNACIASWHSLLKKELICRDRWPAAQVSAQQAIFESSASAAPGVALTERPQDSDNSPHPQGWIGSTCLTLPRISRVRGLGTGPTPNSIEFPYTR